MSIEVKCWKPSQDCECCSQAKSIMEGMSRTHIDITNQSIRKIKSMQSEIEKLNMENTHLSSLVFGLTKEADEDESRESESL